MGKCSIPERWEDYTNMGRQVPGTRFIALKVPLKKEISKNLNSSVDLFGPRSLMDHCSALGLIIDLTNTDRYYDPQEFTEQNIEHIKIKTAGHVIPKEDVIQKFATTVETFLEENSENEKLIGVHCTHGVNRTGYLICRYMIQQLGVPPDQAISDFNSARGHEQERSNYLSDLRSASWRGGRTPEWRDSFTNPSPNSGYTPPYMPHQTGRRNRYSKWNSPSGSDDYTTENYGLRPRSASRSPRNGWSPYGPNGPPSRRREGPAGTGSPLDCPRYGKRSASQLEEGEGMDPPTRPFKSPKFGKEYYERYFQGQVLPQYDADFYSRGGGGVGPHRPPPRVLPPTQQSHGNRPRQYRGPKQYRSPVAPVEPFSYPDPESTPKRKSVLSPSTETPRHSYFKDATADTPKLVPVEGPSRNPLSPGANVEAFTPDNESGRRRSKRFQPY